MKLLFAVAVVVQLAVIACGSEFHVDPETHVFVDRAGRQRIFHGLNVVTKGAPYLPITDHFDPLLSFAEKDMVDMARFGVNAIRLGAMWPGVEPASGSFNGTYISALRSIVRNAAAKGIVSLLDMHQDVLSEKFCGEGAPRWAVDLSICREKFPFPVSLEAYEVDEHGVPTPEECAKSSWSQYYFAECVGKNFETIYKNVTNGPFWKVLAATFKDEDAVLGYELINEPWAGDEFRDPVLMVPGHADKKILAPYYESLVNDYIRPVDSDTVVFFESVTWDDSISVGFEEVPGGAAYRNRSALSYHFYVPPNRDGQISARWKDVQRLRTGGMLTEFAVNPGEEHYKNLVVAAMEDCDKYLQSWTAWDFKPLPGAKTGYSSSIYNADGTYNYDIIRFLARPYPQAVAGVIESFVYEDADEIFKLTYDVDPTITEPTIVYFPSYAWSDVDISFEPSNALNFSVDEYLITLTPKNGYSGRVLVTVRPQQKSSHLGRMP